MHPAQVARALQLHKCWSIKLSFWKHRPAGCPPLGPNLGPVRYTEAALRCSSSSSTGSSQGPEAAPHHTPISLRLHLLTPLPSAGMRTGEVAQHVPRSPWRTSPAATSIAKPPAVCRATINQKSGSHLDCLSVILQPTAAGPSRHRVVDFRCKDGLRAAGDTDGCVRGRWWGRSQV